MKQDRFCPSCGKAIGKAEEFCKTCAPVEDLKFKDFNFDYCERCKKFLIRNKWKDSKSLEDAIMQVVKQNTKQGVKKIVPKVPNVTLAAGVNVDFNVYLEHGGQKYDVPGRFLVTICPKCSKLKTNYFEGILQLRSPKKEVTDFIENMLKSAKAKGIHATDVRDVRGGIDYYITSKKFLRKIGKELKKRFKGELKESAQLFSKNTQTSKDIYRLNVLFRCK